MLKNDIKTFLVLSNKISNNFIDLIQFVRTNYLNNPTKLILLIKDKEKTNNDVFNWMIENGENFRSAILKCKNEDIKEFLDVFDGQLTSISALILESENETLWELPDFNWGKASFTVIAFATYLQYLVQNKKKQFFFLHLGQAITDLTIKGDYTPKDFEIIHTVICNKPEQYQILKI